MSTENVQPMVAGRRGTPSLISTHRVLRNTSGLLSLTLLFSAAAANATVGLPHPGLLLTLAGVFGLLLVTAKLRDSGWSVLSVFGLTGFMAYTLGPILIYNLFVSLLALFGFGSSSD